MIDSAIGILALAVLAGFLAIIVGFVPDVDLAIVAIIVLAMAAYDFYRSLVVERRRR